MNLHSIPWKKWSKAVILLAALLLFASLPHITLSDIHAVEGSMAGGGGASSSGHSQVLQLCQSPVQALLSKGNPKYETIKPLFQIVVGEYHLTAVFAGGFALFSLALLTAGVLNQRKGKKRIAVLCDMFSLQSFLTAVWLAIRYLFVSGWQADNLPFWLSLMWLSVLILPAVLLILLYTLLKPYDSKPQELQAARASFRSNEEMMDSLDQLTNMMNVLAAFIEFRSMDSLQHTRQIQDYVDILARKVREMYPEYGLTEEKCQLIRSASAVHDIGKITTPDSILLKPGRLSANEFEIMKKHSAEGSVMLKRALSDAVDYAQSCYEIARYHHERYDGNGYPEGLVGDAIPIGAQIVSIADVFDALVSSRCYREGYTREEALRMILNGECGQFNPKLLACLIQVKEDFFRTAINASHRPGGLPA